MTELLKVVAVEKSAEVIPTEVSEKTPQKTLESDPKIDDGKTYSIKSTKTI